MAEPYKHWGHIPVFVEDLSKWFYRYFIDHSPHDDGPLVTLDERGIARFNPPPVRTLPEYDRMPAWHREQANAAVDAAIEVNPAAFYNVLPHGFWILIGRSPAPDQREHTVISFVHLYEDLDGVATGKDRPLSIVAELEDRRAASFLGDEFNPYPSLLSKLPYAAKEEWDWFVTCRREKRWKPVPEWLLKIRAEERKAKRRKRKLMPETPGGGL